jgi:hypothetical protein
MVTATGSQARGGVARADRSLALVKQFVDPSLQLPLLDLASAQPLLDIGDRRGGRLRPEGDADEIVAPPDHLGEKGAALARDAQRELLFGNWKSLLNSMLAPLSEMLRTMHSRVVPRSPISATPPYITLSRTLSRRSRIESLPTKRETFTPLCSP